MGALSTPGTRCRRRSFHVKRGERKQHDWIQSDTGTVERGIVYTVVLGVRELDHEPGQSVLRLALAVDGSDELSQDSNGWIWRWSTCARRLRMRSVGFMSITFI